MEYFAGLDVSMEETHICVLDREGVLIREEKTATSPKAISDLLARTLPCLSHRPLLSGYDEPRTLS